jgi:HlyD family secretion protein
LLKPREFGRLWQVSRLEAVIAAVTFVVTLLAAPALYWGVLAGVLMSLSHFLYQHLHPRILEVGEHPDGSLRSRTLWRLPPIAPRVLALEREGARLDGLLGETTASEAQAETQLSQIDLSRLEKSATYREQAETELRDLGYRELELAERRRALTEQIARLEIRAPVSGIVQELQVTTPRSVIRPADPIMFIIPQDRPLVVAARIATINIDEVHPGQQVVLRFSSFSSRTTPEIDGILTRVSADALVDQTAHVSYYRAEVTIPPDQIAKLALVPGMPVEVYVQTGERSPFAYLVKPLSDYFIRAFRES